MKAGRLPLPLGTHGMISTRTLGNGLTRAAARLRLWDGDVYLVTAVGATAQTPERCWSTGLRRDCDCPN